MKSSSVKFVGVICFYLLSILNYHLVESSEEENCQWKPDGSKVCEGGTKHNVWTEEAHDASDKVGSRTIEEFLQNLQKNDVDMERLELELILNYLDEDLNGKIELVDLERAMDLEPLQIVKKLLTSFSEIDADIDGKMSKAELEEAFKTKNFVKDFVKNIEKNFVKDFTKPDISLLDYIDLISKLDPSFHSVLQPFKNLVFLNHIEIFKVIEGSVKMFSEMDEDQSGGLDLGEYLNSLEKDQSKNKMTQSMGTEEKKTIFDMLDRDKDGEISYPEFQTVMPQKPKNIAGNLKLVFKRADLNSDGFWDKDEFKVHLNEMSTKMGRPEPTESELLEAFSKLDKDEDKLVSEEEMKGILGEIEKLQMEKSTKAFNEMDVDGDGVLSRDEMSAIAKLMEMRSGGEKFDVDILIKMLDTNSDGFIQQDEMHKLAKRMVPVPP